MWKTSLRLVGNFHVITARVAKRAKVIFSQTSVCSTRGEVAPDASWDRSHGHGGRWTSPPPWTGPRPPSPLDRTPTPPPHIPGQDTHTPLGRTPSRKERSLTYHPLPQHLGTMHRRVECIVLECILVSNNILRLCVSMMVRIAPWKFSNH